MGQVILTTGTFNLFVKDPSGLSAWAGPLGSRLQPEVGVSSNLVRSARITAHFQRCGRFCANLLRISNFNHPVKPDLRYSRGFAPRNLSNDNRPKSTRQARARCGELAGDLLPGAAMVMFSVGFPTGVKSLMLYDPANLLPSSLTGQAKRPPGGSTAQFDLPKSSTGYSEAQPANLHALSA